ncbi:GYF domain-containing protein [Floccifex sp.]|uniref:GYF domain-containing protein n=1 Tax=Floccifex sp. TaxID=2815810 RepID=UPI003F0167AB
MICKNCGEQIPESAKFCPNCGSKIEIEQVNEDGWYFVENGKSNGAYTKDEMISFYQQGRIQKNTYVWKSGLQDWISFEDSKLVDFKEEEEPVKEFSSDKQWYYINVNNEQVGPLDEKEIISLIEKKTISANSYVWTSGMADWEFVKNSPLSIYLKQEKQAQQTETIYTQETINNPVFIQKRSVGLYLLLTIVTCGIFGLYWMYCIARDTDTLCQNQTTSPGMVVLLSFITCGVYGWYFYYRTCKRLHALQFSNGYVVPDDSVIVLILALLSFSIVSLCIIQSTINDIQTFAN